MTFSAAVVTTMPNDAWDVYGKRMLAAFSQFWPSEIPILVALDDDLLLDSAKKFMRSQDGISIGWGSEHKDFVNRNRDKDHVSDYRYQPVRFCHKVFAIARAYDASLKQKQAGEVAPRYLIWMDADVIINRPVSLSDIQECLPKAGDAVATLQRKDWPHSECGWIAFDLENGGGEIISMMVASYISDEVLSYEQQHDSWVFDQVVKTQNALVTNLTLDVPGLDVWQYSPMAKWSRHYKGPMAKSELINSPRQNQQQVKQNIVIQTQNALPHEEIRAHIAENQKFFTQWVKPCLKTDEEIVIVSAGPMLVPEDLRQEKGKKIVAVKHAIEPLRKAGIKPWACILLDPRPHVNDFVQNPDKDIIWFVASQVNPEVVKTLLCAGCDVWGYHAAVNAGEQELTHQQAYSVISGGSATATRGIFLLSHLGFSNFRLYGYDLCHPDKPDLNAKDERGQPKNLEISVGFNDKYHKIKRHFWTEPQLIAQFEEMNDIVRGEKFQITAFGDGVVPFLVKAKKTSDLRNKEIAAKMLGGKITTYKELLRCRTSKTSWQKWLPSSLRKRS